MWSPREVRVFLARHFYQGVKRLIFQSSQSYNFPGAVNLALTISTNEQCEEVAELPVEQLDGENDGNADRDSNRNNN